MGVSRAVAEAAVPVPHGDSAEWAGAAADDPAAWKAVLEVLSMTGV